MSSRIALPVILAAIAVLGGAPAASASQGSVPAEVAAYASDPDGLLARLDDLAGVGGNGQGIDFGDGAKVGQLNRVFEFTAAFSAGEQTETPVQRTNRWTAPISLGDRPLGVAIIWINDATVRPDVADFTEGTTIGAALADVPADAALVRDEPRDAWFALVGEELTPLVPGTSGVDAPTALNAYQAVVAAPPAEAAPAAGVPALSIVVIAGSALVIIAVLLVPPIRERVRARRAAEPTAVPAEDPPAEDSPAPVAEAPAAPATEDPVADAPVAEPKPAKAKAATTRSGSTKTGKPPA